MIEGELAVSAQEVEGLLLARIRSKAIKYERCGVDRLMTLVADTDRQSVMVPVLWQDVPRDLRQHTLRFAADGIKVGTFHAVLIEPKRPIVDVEIIESHQPLLAQQAGAHEVSQARKAKGRAAIFTSYEI